MHLAGLPPRPDWTSGQSLLPLIDPSFGEFDRSKSPITSVFGTLSVRPSVEGFTQYRYFRYPNGEEHVYDIENDPGETTNLVDTAPMDFLRDELVKGSLELGLDLRGFENPSRGVNAMMAVDGSVVLAGGGADNDYWAYGQDVEKISEEKDGGTDTLWYMAGPDDYVLHCPANIEKIRIATVVSRKESDVSVGKPIKIVAHPDSPIEFETSERVMVDVTGSTGNDIMFGPKYSGATFYGGAGDDQLIAKATLSNARHYFYGEAGNDYLSGGAGNDLLDGGTGDDVLHGRRGNNKLYGGHGNDQIFDGDGTSFVDTGPGRNTVVLNDGDDEVVVGTGINQIDAGTGAVTFRIKYGGITIIKPWSADQTYDLSDWPEAPEIQALDGAKVRLRLGLSIVELHRASDAARIKKQIQQDRPNA
jgi:hypothetical protein